jgi:uncharacterized iron-regulated membrane protein
MKRLVRKLHRWLGLLMALQIIAWMASGLYFSLFPIAEIRGEHLTRAPEGIAARDLVAAGRADVLLEALDDHFRADWTLSGVSLVTREGTAYWLAEGEAAGIPFRRLVDPTGTGVRPALTSEQAERRATWWLKEPATVAGSEWIEPETAPGEFRGRETSAWKVSVEGSEAVSLYIEPWTGDLLARRTARWRWFDFFWMLHIMDYDTRDDFNHPLLQAAAALGLLIALSGVLYWFMTRRGLQRRAA